MMDHLMIIVSFFEVVSFRLLKTTLFYLCFESWWNVPVNKYEYHPTFVSGRQLFWKEGGAWAIFRNFDKSGKGCACSREAHKILGWQQIFACEAGTLWFCSLKGSSANRSWGSCSHWCTVKCSWCWNHHRCSSGIRLFRHGCRWGASAPTTFRIYHMKLWPCQELLMLVGGTCLCGDLNPFFFLFTIVFCVIP